MLPEPHTVQMDYQIIFLSHAGFFRTDYYYNRLPPSLPPVSVAERHHMAATWYTAPRKAPGSDIHNRTPAPPDT